MPGASGDFGPQDPNQVGSNWLTQLSDFLANTSKGIARTPVSPFTPFSTHPTQPMPTPEQVAAPVASTGLAGGVRNVVPDRFANVAQSTVEGMPRMGADVASLMTPAAPAGLADMGL